MRLMPASYNGFLFQQINRVASDFANPYDWNIQGITTSDLQRSQNFPLRVVKNYAGAIKVINVNLLDVDLTRDELVMAMDVLGAEQIQLIATDEFGRSWYVNADFIGLTEDSNSGKTAAFGAVFAVDDPIWKKLIPSTASLTTNGSGAAQYLYITPIGNQPALPIITITPNSGGGNDFGFLYQRFVTVYNKSPNAFTTYPIDITGGGLDTATLIGANKMLANGDDCRVYVNGVDVKRWFGGGGINNASTTIWINLTSPANNDMTLGVNIAGTGAITEIEIENTAANIAMLPKIPLSGNVLINSEIFVYTGVDIGTRKLTGVTRAQKQTSAGTHTDTDLMVIIPEVWLYYGNPNIAPYVVDDTRKPVIDLATSTNQVHNYVSEFYSADGQRTAVWKQGTYLPALLSRHYTATENTLTDPASVVGTWCKERSLLWWMLYNPCGFEEITSMTGKKYSANGVFDVTVNQSELGNLFDMVFRESSPGAGAGWVALDAHTAIALVPGSVSARIFYLLLWTYGHTGPAGVNENGMEIDTASLTLDSNYTPVISLAAEAVNFNIHSIIANLLTTDSLTVDLSLEFAKYVVIDTKEKTVTLYDGSNQINAILDFPIRAEWLQLLPQQENIIAITEEGEVTYLFTWEDRSL
jgi:hypothetical protein